jgi:hypothetical protein
MPPKRLPVFEKPAWLKSLLPVNLKPFSGGANSRAWVNLKEFAFKVPFYSWRGSTSGASERNDPTTYHRRQEKPDATTLRVVSLRGAQKRARDSLGTGISTRADE